MIGLLNFNKPVGVTSRDAVDRVQRRLPRKTKVGHAGTLDPLAEGVLLLCVGRATRLIPYIHLLSKSYHATFRLGCESVTEDTEGELVARPDDPQPSLAEIEAVLPSFVGEVLQRPPKFSALKVGGTRAYKLARGGNEVELEPRLIQVHAISVVRYDYPELVLDIDCGTGTYVRSLGRDIAESLGTAAVMSGLVRTRIGEFTLEDAVLPADLTIETLSDYLIPHGSAVGGMPRVTLTEAEVAPISKGLPIADRFGLAESTPELAAFDAAGRLVAILVNGRGAGRKGWGPLRNFADLL